MREAEYHNLKQTLRLMPLTCHAAVVIINAVYSMASSLILLYLDARKLDVDQNSCKAAVHQHHAHSKQELTIQQQCVAFETSCMRHMPRMGHADGEILSESLPDRSGCDSINYTLSQQEERAFQASLP